MPGIRKKRGMQTQNRIRSLRERKAWTQEQLAEAARIALRTVQRAEDGAMSAETKTAIAGALDVPVEKLDAEQPPAIQPVLMYADSRAAVDWLSKAFGFEVLEKVTDAGGQVDVDAHFARAKKAGARIVAGLEESYGQRRYRVLDLEDHEWCFSTSMSI